MMGSERFSTKSNVPSIGELRGSFVYDGATGLLPLLSQAAYVYDAMPELVRAYGAPMATCPRKRNSDAPGTCGALPATSPSVWDTSGQHDGESGLDYFGARYFSAAMGRFTSPDWSATPQPVPYADLGDPQTLNLYGYVRGNPLRFRDPDGHGMWDWVWTVRAPPKKTPPPPKPPIPQSNTPPSPQPGRQPDGSYVAPTGPGSEIAHLRDPNHVPSQADCIPNGECVAATKHFSGMKAATYQWSAGTKVVNADRSVNNIAPGTAIATFDSDGHYPLGEERNSGIFLGPAGGGAIWLLDQWPAKPAINRPARPPQPRIVPLNDQAGVSDNSGAYSVIVVKWELRI